MPKKVKKITKSGLTSLIKEEFHNYEKRTLTEVSKVIEELKKQQKIISETTNPELKRQLQESFWSKTKWLLSRLGGIEKGGKFFGSGKQSQEAEKELEQVKDLMSKSANKEMQELDSRLKNEFDDFPNMEDHEEFMKAVGLIAAVYDSIAKAVEDGKTTPLEANALVDALHKYVDKIGSYDLSAIYKRFAESKETQKEHVRILKEAELLRREAVLRGTGQGLASYDVAKSNKAVIAWLAGALAAYGLSQYADLVYHVMQGGDVPVPPPPVTGDTIKYTTTNNDIVSRIAERHGCSVEEILKLNPQITNPDVLTGGKVLTLPAKATGHAIYANNIGTAEDTFAKMLSGKYSPSQITVDRFIESTKGNVELAQSLAQKSGFSFAEHGLVLKGAAGSAASGASTSAAVAKSIVTESSRIKKERDENAYYLLLEAEAEFPPKLKASIDALKRNNKTPYELAIAIAKFLKKMLLSAAGIALFSSITGISVPALIASGVAKAAAAGASVATTLGIPAYKVAAAGMVLGKVMIPLAAAGVATWFIKRNARTKSRLAVLQGLADILIPFPIPEGSTGAQLAPGTTPDKPGDPEKQKPVDPKAAEKAAQDAQAAAASGSAASGSKDQKGGTANRILQSANDAGINPEQLGGRLKALQYSFTLLGPDGGVNVLKSQLIKNINPSRLVKLVSSFKKFKSDKEFTSSGINMRTLASDLQEKATTKGLEELLKKLVEEPAKTNLYAQLLRFIAILGPVIKKKKGRAVQGPLKQLFASAATMLAKADGLYTKVAKTFARKAEKRTKITNSERLELEKLLTEFLQSWENTYNMVNKAIEIMGV